MSTFPFHTPAALCGYPDDTPMLLALSGGADSRLLLHLCAQAAKASGAPLHVAHVHHGIRGKEADRDADFCRALAERYGCPFHMLSADVPAIAQKSGETLEQAARRVRYGYFASLVREHRIPMLLTAHHATDNLETVLFRLCRGTGLGGLGGIAPVRPFTEACCEPSALSPVIVRPLLDASREDIIAECERLGLDFVTDSTNADTVYTRNHIRANVLPTLTRIADHPERQVSRLCATLREDEDALAALSEQLLRQARQGQALCRKTLFAAHPAIAKRAIMRWLTEQTGRAPEAVHVEAVLALCHPDATSRACDIIGHTVFADRTHLRLTDAASLAPTPPSYSIELTEGEHSYPELGIHVRLERMDDHTAVTANSNIKTNVYKPFIRDTLTFDTMIPYTPDACLVLRPRHEGDRLLWRGVHRKVRKLQNEHGIPVHARDRVPVLCHERQVIWLPGIGLRDGISADACTHRLTLTVFSTIL